MHDALFLPGRARQLFRSTFRAATLHVEVQLPPPRLGPHLVAIDVGHRQRRRKTWQQNLARYELPEEAGVHIRLDAGPHLRRMLGDRDDRPETGVGGAC